MGFGVYLSRVTAATRVMMMIMLYEGGGALNPSQESNHETTNKQPTVLCWPVVAYTKSLISFETTSRLIIRYPCPSTMYEIMKI